MWRHDDESTWASRIRVCCWLLFPALVSVQGEVGCKGVLVGSPSVSKSPLAGSVVMQCLQRV